MSLQIELVRFGENGPWPARDIAELHQEFLPRSFSCQLGRPFLERFYYGALPEEDLLFGSGIYVNGKLGAFAVGAFQRDSFMKLGALRRPSRMAWTLAQGVAAKPSRVGVIARTVTFGAGREKASGDGPVCETLTKIVRPEYVSREFKQQYGTFSSAVSVSNFQTLLRRNIFRLRAMVERDNEVMNRRMLRVGHRLIRDSVPGFGVPMLEYEIDLLKHDDTVQLAFGKPPLPGMVWPDDLAHIRSRMVKPVALGPDA